jgi:cytochrome c553
MNIFKTTLFALVVTCVTASSLAQEIKGNAAEGHKKNAMCIGCHGLPGYQSSFPEIYKVPKISGQSAKYIVAALNAYKQGERKHPTMRSQAESLSDQDMADLGAYYESHGHGGGAAAAARPSQEPSPKVAELMKKENAVCVSCHGDNFAKPISPEFPKIAGQHADYMFVALKAYKTENNPKVGRSNGVMAAVAKKFTNAELKALAAYVSSLDGDLKTIPENRFR